jgi:hypothetical protein
MGQIEDERAKIVILETRIERIITQIEGYKSERDEALEQIKALHLKYVTEPCDTCSGDGEVDDVEWGTTSNPEALSPPEIPIRVECPDCLGTGCEWMV